MSKGQWEAADNVGGWVVSCMYVHGTWMACAHYVHTEAHLVHLVRVASVRHGEGGDGSSYRLSTPRGMRLIELPLLAAAVTRVIVVVGAVLRDEVRG